MSLMDLLTVVNSDLVRPLNEGGVKIVKSVQRGISKGNTTSIAISEVNPDKCLVVLNGLLYEYSALYLPILLSLTSTSLKIVSSNVSSNAGNDGWRWSWQVIEFY